MKEVIEEALENAAAPWKFSFFKILKIIKLKYFGNKTFGLKKQLNLRTLSKTLIPTFAYVCKKHKRLRCQQRSAFLALQPTTVVAAARRIPKAKNGPISECTLISAGKKSLAYAA